MTDQPRRRRLPPAMAQRAREFVARGAEPVLARRASTVVVVRDTVDTADRTAAAGIEVYVHRRHRGMRFAGGMVAFPGGGVDPADVAEAVADEEVWARRLGVDDPSAARGHVAAAVRELAEETGLAVDTGNLMPWAHWITPTFEERRYDTWFFLLPLPYGDSLRDVSGETEGVDWVRPSDELARADAGDSTVLPPTRAVLEELARFGTVDAAVAAAADRVISTVLPSWSIEGDDVVVTVGGAS